jgi:vitamin B12 transporter
MKQRNSLYLVISALVICIFLINGLEAQDAKPIKEDNAEKSVKDNNDNIQKDEKAVKLNTLVITATRTKEKQKDVPSNLEVITAKEIEASGEKTLGDIIGEKVTGHYHRYSGLSQPAGLMGNLYANDMGDDTSNRIVVLIDGHRLGTGNMGKIPPEIVDRIEVIKGSASALYGSAAMGGVINIITKKGSGNIKNTVNLETGSFDYTRSALTSGGDINDLAGYFITGSYMQSGDYKTKNYGTAYNSDQKQAQAWGNLSFYPSNNQSLRIGFSYADITYHYPEWKNYPAGHTYYIETTRDYSDLSRGHTDLEYNLGMMENTLNWKASFYYLWDRRSWNYGRSGKAEDDADSFTDHTSGSDQELEISFIPYNKILVGYTFELLKRDAKSKRNGVTAANTTPDFKYYTNSVYCQDTVSLAGNSLLIIFGARYDRFDLMLENSESNSNVTFDNVSPRGGLVYKPMDLFRLRANAGKAFRAPNADELAMLNRDFFFTGNPDLKPEKSTTYDAGFDIYPDNITLGATYSFIKTQDLINYDYSHTDGFGNDWYTYKNIDKAKMEIIDCYVNLEAGKMFGLPAGINLYSNFTYNKKYEDIKSGKDISFIADREVKSNIQAVYKSMTVTLAHVYVGHEKNKDGSDKGSFYFFNLTLNYSISAGVSIQAGIFNLTNEDYEWVRYYPAPERNYKLGITGKF